MRTTFTSSAIVSTAFLSIAFVFCCKCLYYVHSTSIAMVTISCSGVCKAIIFVTDIDENSGDVWFDKKILNRYEPKLGAHIVLMLWKLLELGLFIQNIKECNS